jgi:hypothetical protein
MPGKAAKIITEEIEGIPLYLIAATIAGQIRKKRETVLRIRVERKKQHRYRVTVETRDGYAPGVNTEAPARTDT